MVNPKRTIIVGLGNRILGDDAVGLIIAEKLEPLVAKNDNIKVIVGENLGGMNLVEQIVGYDTAIIIDSIKTDSGKVGNIYKFTPDRLEHTIHLTSLHNINLATAIALSTKLGLDLPSEIIIIGIEVAQVDKFTADRLTPEVESAIPKAIQLILEELKPVFTGALSGSSQI